MKYAFVLHSPLQETEPVFQDASEITHSELCNRLSMKKGEYNSIENC